MPDWLFVKSFVHPWGEYSDLISQATGQPSGSELWFFLQRHRIALLSCDIGLEPLVDLGPPLPFRHGLLEGERVERRFRRPFYTSFPLLILPHV